MNGTIIGKLKLGHSQNLRIIFLIILVGVLFAILTIYQSDSPASSNTPVQDSDFLSIPLQDLNGNNIYIKDFEGKVVILEFMATWCNTCRQQEPILKELQSIYKSENVFVIAVSIQPEYDTPDILRSEINQREISWLVTRDTTLEMTRYFQVTELSTILIISPDGEAKNLFKGLTDLNTLSQAVDKFV